MNLTVKQSYILIGAGPALSLGVGLGVYLGIFLTKKNLENKYLAISNKEIAEAKQFYSVLHKKDEFESPESAVESLGLTSAVKALKDYQGLVVEDVDKVKEVKVIETLEVEIPAEEITHNIFTEAQIESGFDYEEELKNRSENKPYIISHDEFMEAEPGFNQVTVTYYEGDNVLTDEKDAPISDVEYTIGEDSLQKFGHGSNDNKIVYVRNEVLDLDFEVIHSNGTYVEEVLGFIEHSDHRKKIRKFRGDDE